ncbi:MAG: alpha/beta fold hydrolase [Pseudomonadota bacterium]
MNSKHISLHELIDLIYEAAVDPQKWLELLDALAEFAEQGAGDGNSIAQLGVAPTDVGEAEATRQHASMIDALKNLNSLAADQGWLRQPSASQPGGIHDILMEHFKRALMISKRLADMEESHDIIASLLDQLPIALVIVNKDARILEANSRALALLAQKAGLRENQHRLSCAKSDMTRRLHTVIGELSSSGVPELRSEALYLSCEDDDHTDLMAVLVPIKPRLDEAESTVAVFISPRKQQPFNLPQAVAELYHLTAKESDIVNMLVRGHSIGEIAKQTWVSEHTVRTHVKSILAKTHTRRQAELVSLMLTGPGSLIKNTLQEFTKQDVRLGLIKPRMPHSGSPRTLLLCDDRIMAYQEYGDPKGQPVIICHSVLGCRLELPVRGHELAAERGLHLIIPDRPGFGGSDAKPFNGFTEWCADLGQLADALKLDDFHLAGYAMGGRYAMAAATVMPQRIRKLALVSVGLAPQTEADLKLTIPIYRMNLRLARDLPQVHRIFVSLMRKGIMSNPRRFLNFMATKMGPTDAKVFQTQDFEDSFYTILSEGIHQGGLGFAHEVAALMQPWDFDPAAITVPLDQWHGVEDNHVPFVLAKRLADQLPQVKLRTVPKKGHYLYFSQFGEILDALLSA